MDEIRYLEANNFEGKDFIGVRLEAFPDGTVCALCNDGLFHDFAGSDLNEFVGFSFRCFC